MYWERKFRRVSAISRASAFHRPGFPCPFGFSWYFHLYFLSSLFVFLFYLLALFLLLVLWSLSLFLVLLIITLVLNCWFCFSLSLIFYIFLEYCWCCCWSSFFQKGYSNFWKTLCERYTTVTGAINDDNCRFSFTFDIFPSLSLHIPLRFLVLHTP